MRGVIVYFSEYGKRIADEIAVENEIGKFSCEDKIAEKIKNNGCDFLIKEKDDKLFSLVEKTGWFAYRKSSIELITSGRGIKFDICYLDSANKIFEKYLSVTSKDAVDFAKEIKLDIYRETNKEKFSKIKSLLNRIGLYPNLSGYGYIIDALALVDKDEKVLLELTKKLYPSIAKARGVTEKSVERNIRNAIDIAFSRGKMYKEISAFGGNLDKNEKPTNGEFLAFLSTII